MPALWSEVLRDSTGAVTGLIEIVADITERKLLEQQALQAQKMDAIARLASGVAHDFNNLLTVITGYTHCCWGNSPPTTRRTAIWNRWHARPIAPAI